MPLVRPMCKKPYPERMDKMIALSSEFETPCLTTFLGKSGMSTTKHVGKFTSQYGEARQNEYYILQLFPLSLTWVTFNWYSSLSPNSVVN